MLELAKAVGLDTEEPVAAEGLTAVYDGKTLVLEESSWSIVTLLRLLWRYWLSWLPLRTAPAVAFAKFEGAGAGAGGGRGA